MSSNKKRKNKKQSAKQKKSQVLLGVMSLTIHFAVIIALIACYDILFDYFAAIIASLSAIFVTATFVIQAKRWRDDKYMLNLFPLLGYIFLILYTITIILTQLPKQNIPFLNYLHVGPFNLWQIAIVLLFASFLMLAFWAWQFIKIRSFLKTYISFLAQIIGISSFGAFLFAILAFNSVNQNHLNIVNQIVKTQKLLLAQNINNTRAVVLSAANERNIQTALAGHENDVLYDRLQNFAKKNASKLDLKIYNTEGELISRYSHDNDKLKIPASDNLVDKLINEGKPLNTFGRKLMGFETVLIARSAVPIEYNGETIGAMEAIYTFDDEFANYTKMKTGADITIYVSDEILATTLEGFLNNKYADGQIEQAEIKTAVLSEGQNYGNLVVHNGKMYYSAYEPITDESGQIIGVLEAGIPSQGLLEQTRQRLLTTFMTLVLIFSSVALIGYYVLYIFYENNSKS